MQTHDRRFAYTVTRAWSNEVDGNYGFVRARKRFNDELDTCKCFLISTAQS